MNGKLFLSLVVGLLGVVVAATRLAGGERDWQAGIWLLLGAAWLVRAFFYWRSANAQGS